MWRETYDAALAGVAAGDCAAEKLLAAVRASVDASAEPSAEAKARLSAIGREITQPLSELLAMDRTTPRQTRLGVFKLQLVARLLLCCEDGAFAAEDDQKAPRGKAKAASKKKSKQKTMKKTSLAQELRELLDRVALLVEAANPASIGDSEDEPSPFHSFLVNVLEKQLGGVIPGVFSYIRKEYELVNEVDEPQATAHSIQLTQKTPTPSKMDQTPSSSSILSALRDERPSKKRSLAATSEAFKEVNLPESVSRTSSSVDRLAKRLNTSKGDSRSSSHPPSILSKPSTRRSVDTSLSSLAAASKKTRPSNSYKALSNTMPMLVRNVDRNVLLTQVPGVRRTITIPPTTASARAHAGGSSRPPTNHPIHTLNTNHTSRASIVMRTPDRPRRQQSSQPRILVEASPPLRNPFPSARIRRAGSQLPK